MLLMANDLPRFSTLNIGENGMANRARDRKAKFNTHGYEYYKGICITKKDSASGIRQYKIDYGQEAIGKRRRTFRTPDDAKGDITRYKIALKKYQNEGVKLSAEQGKDASMALDLLEGFDADLVKVAKYYVKNHAKADPDKTIGHLIDLYLAEKQEQVEIGDIRPRSYTDIKGRVKLLRDNFGDRDVRDVDTDDLRKLLKQFKRQNRANYKRHISMFFIWAIREKFIHENPAKKLKYVKLKNKSPEIYTPEKTRNIMNVCREPDTPRGTEMIPYFALAFFGGVRPDEILRLDWSDILFDENTIRIRESVSKTDDDRTFTMPDNLREWLLTCPNRTGKVFPYSESSRQRWRSEICKIATVQHLQDGARHSMATYYYELNGLEETIDLLGHSDKVLFRHYKNRNKGRNSKTKAKEYFNICPKHSKNKVFPVVTDTQSIA